MITFLLSLTYADTLDDIRLTSMSDWDGRPYTSSSSQFTAYEQVVKQLGAAITTPIIPANTLGVWGFEFGIHQSFSFIDTQKSLDNRPSAWALLTPDEDLFPILVHPKVIARKGLPLSAELEISMGYIFLSRQGTFGGALRVAPIEGYHIAPDVAFQIGYQTYISNPELSLGTFDTSMVVSKRFGLSYLTRLTTAHAVPFFSIGTATINTAPKISKEQQENLNVMPLSGFSGSPYFSEGLSNLFINSGLRLENQEYSFQIDYRYTFNTLSTFSMAMVWHY
ncbi:MAG: hypothetical protein CL916_13040 [Deltaproteobacteria bacterium]|nr:hypothetical protein [Deltaproteobacteria bacterium]